MTWKGDVTLLFSGIKQNSRAKSGRDILTDKKRIMLLISLLIFACAFSVSDAAIGTLTLSTYALTVKVGSPISVTCKYTPGDPLISLQWYNGPGYFTTYTTTSIPKSESNFQKASATVDDAGLYRCEAKTTIGPTITGWVTIKIGGCAMKRIASSEQYAGLGSSLTLTCQLPFYDYSDVSWTKDNTTIITKIENKTKYATKMEDYRGYYSLVITDLELSDAGQYECRCSGMASKEYYYLYVAEPMLNASSSFTYALMVNGKRRKVGDHLDFYPGDDVSVTSSVKATDTFPGPQRTLTWKWDDSWLAEMYQPIDSSIASPYRTLQSTTYSYSYSLEVTIISSCNEYNMGYHGLLLHDDSERYLGLTANSKKILTVACNPDHGDMSPTDVTSLVAAFVHAICITMIAVNVRKHRALMKGTPFHATAFMVVVLEVIMVTSLIFVPTMQSIGRLGKAEITTRAQVGAGIMGVVCVIVAAAAIGVESWILNDRTVHPEQAEMTAPASPKAKPGRAGSKASVAPSLAGSKASVAPSLAGSNASVAPSRAGSKASVTPSRSDSNGSVVPGQN